MGFSIGCSMLGNWLAKKAQKKKIKFLQKAKDNINKALEAIGEYENECLEEAASELVAAGSFGGRFASTHLESKETAERRAKRFTNVQALLLEDLALFQRLEKKEIEALQNGDFTISKRQMRFLF